MLFNEITRVVQILHGCASHSNSVLEGTLIHRYIPRLNIMKYLELRMF